MIMDLAWMNIILNQTGKETGLIHNESGHPAASTATGPTFDITFQSMEIKYTSSNISINQGTCLH